ncbi:LysR substrate-binding domain-containing protein [Photobacterium rosenbergii]|uniref:LysR substrate-binding domain-containing protein n=1 Tax=Photobacterium rosenbergii TaxID=294936 RepID=UPI001C9A283A|nr:LysR substrate-binding domain-containing protein [Photobacterium rosenbergii]MBY5944385.1 LysR family transcriptional regulator [Photobacterium rosenbergii]
MKDLPTTKELTAFLVTSKTLSFTSAADELNVTQGAISRQIIALENRLKTPLFHRQARGLALTDKGKEFLPLIEKAVNQIQHAVAKVSADENLVKLKAPSCITTWLLPKLMAFQQAHPDIDVELTSAINHSVNFSTEPFNAAICYGHEPQSTELAANLLFEEILAPMCSPELVSAKLCSPSLIAGDENEMTADAMSQYTWLHATPDRSDWNLWLSKTGNTHAVFASQNQHFATLDLAVSASLQGFGIAIGDVTLAKPDLDSHRLIMPNNNTVASGKGYYLMYPVSQQSKAMKRLIQWLIDH